MDLSKKLKDLQKKKNLGAILTFASFMFIQYVILCMSKQAGVGFLTSEAQESVYYLLQPVVILGFLLFALFDAHLPEKARRPVSFAALCVCFAGTTYQFFASCASVFGLAVAVLSVFSLGYVGGSVYRGMSDCSSEKSGVRVGICMGAGCAVAVALQYLLQLRFTVKPLLGVFLAAAFFLLALPLRVGSQPGCECAGEAEAQNEEEKKEGPEEDAEHPLIFRLVCAVVITVAMLLFTGYFNSYIHRLRSEAFTWPRLMWIPGFLLFGFLGDYKKGKLLPLSALCVAVTALLNAALIGKGSAHRLNMCLFYLSLSAAVSFYNLTFWRLARKTGRPSFWASMGRMLDSFVILPNLFFNLSDLPTAAVLAMNLAALAFIIILMAINGDLNLSHLFSRAEKPLPGASTDRKTPCGEDDVFDVIGKRFLLTQSEMKVFRELVLTEDKQIVISEHLNVKVRTVQANVTAIYRKTGVSTRSGLVQLYHGFSSEKASD